MAELLLQYAARVNNLAARGVLETFAREHPLFDSLYFQDVPDGFSLPFTREASLGGVGFRPLNGDYAAAAKTSGRDVRGQEPLAVIGGLVYTDRLMPTTRPTRITQKAKAAARSYVRNFVRGDRSTDENGIDGLYKRIGGDNLVYGGANGGALKLMVLDKLLARIPGPNTSKRLIMGSMMQITLGVTLRQKGATNIGMAEWQGENTPLSYNGAKIILAGEDEDGAEIMQFNETRGNVATTGSILACRLGTADEEYVIGLCRKAAQGIFDIEDHGVRGTQIEDLVEGLAGLGTFHPKAACRYAGITEAVES